MNGENDFQTTRQIIFPGREGTDGGFDKGGV